MAYMSNIDLFSYVLLAVGLLLAFLLFFAKKRNKFVAQNFPRVFGLGVGIFLFISLIVARELFFPTTDLFDHIVHSFFLSLVMGVEVWIVFGITEWLGKRRK
jgi:hypothetical protein